MLNKLILLGCLLFSTASYGHKLITVTAPHPDSYVSKYLKVLANTSNQIIYTVPTGKTFVLTDVILTGYGDIKVGTETRFGTETFANPPSIHFVSGIKFVAGEAITYTPAPATAGSITLSGYLY